MKLVIMSTRVPTPSSQRHFRSRFVSPRNRLNVRYDMGEWYAPAGECGRATPTGLKGRVPSAQVVASRRRAEAWVGDTTNPRPEGADSLWNPPLQGGGDW